MVAFRFLHWIAILNSVEMCVRVHVHDVGIFERIVNNDCVKQALERWKMWQLFRTAGPFIRTSQSPHASPSPSPSNFLRNSSCSSVPQRHRNNVFDLPSSSRFTGCDTTQKHHPLNVSQCVPLKYIIFIVNCITVNDATTRNFAGCFCWMDSHWLGQYMRRAMHAIRETPVKLEIDSNDNNGR